MQPSATLNLLRVELKADKDVIWVNVMPGTHPPSAQAFEVTFTLTVTDEYKTDYKGVSPDSPVYKFWVMAGPVKLWEEPVNVAHHPTEVKIPAGKPAEYQATWKIPDVHKLPVRTLLGFAEFVPSSQVAQFPVEVKLAR
jgi:hypothetical protein